MTFDDYDELPEDLSNSDGESDSQNSSLDEIDRNIKKNEEKRKKKVDLIVKSIFKM